jgi:hypothetical protein
MLLFIWNIFIINKYIFFNINLYFINKLRVKIKFIEQKYLQKNYKVIIIMRFILHRNIIFKCS